MLSLTADKQNLSLNLEGLVPNRQTLEILLMMGKAFFFISCKVMKRVFALRIQLLGSCDRHLEAFLNPDETTFVQVRQEHQDEYADNNADHYYRARSRSSALAGETSFGG